MLSVIVVLLFARGYICLLKSIQQYWGIHSKNEENKKLWGVVQPNKDLKIKNPKCEIVFQGKKA